MQELKRLRKEKNWSQVRLAEESGVDRATINQAEGGHRSPTIETLEKLALAMGTEVADFFPKAQAPLPDSEERRAAEPLSPKMRRFAASMRRAHLEHIYKHLTLRLETLLEQAKAYLEAGDRPGLWTVFMDASTLRAGAEALLAEMREEAQNLGGETEKERHLGGRVEHRVEDFEEETERIGDMWNELLDADNEAKNDRHRSPGDVDDLQAVRKRRAG